MARKIPIDVIQLAAGYKASREGKGRDIATQEMMEALPAMGFEIDHGGEKDPLEITQPIFNPLTAGDEY